MKKLLLALSLVASVGVAQAANFVSFDLAKVKNTDTNAKSTAQVLTAGKDMFGLNFGLEARNQVLDNGGMFNRVEVTAGKKLLKHFDTFLGFGHDNGFNGAKNGSFQYAVVGTGLSHKVGPFVGSAGVKTRLNWESDNPKQTLGFVGLALPVNKQLSVNAGFSKSFQDIKEESWNFGVRFAF